MSMRARWSPVVLVSTGTILVSDNFVGELRRPFSLPQGLMPVFPPKDPVGEPLNQGCGIMILSLKVHSANERAVESISATIALHCVRHCDSPADASGSIA
jgi:hypothetical protein